jgi:DNA-binding NarL/FixJ family response regulator
MLAHFRELAARAAEGIDAEGVDAFDKIAERERAQRDAQAGVGNGGSPRGAAGPEGLPGGAPSLAALIPEIALSPRETEVLSYIGRGLRVTEAARVLGLTDHTVAGYVKSLYRKLNISSRAEAALEAARRGLV